MISLLLLNFLVSHSVETTSHYASKQFAQDVLYRGNEESWDWKAGVNYMSTSTPNKRDHTYGFRGGLGWRKNWIVEGDFDYATTSNESLQVFGPSLVLGYRFQYGVALRKTDFAPFFETTSNFGMSYFKGRNLSLNQYAMGASLEWAMLEVLSGIAHYQHHIYSKDPANFMAALHSTKVIQKRYVSFSPNLIGFSKQVFKGTLTTHLFKKLHIDIGGSILKSEVGSSWDQIASLSGRYQVFKSFGISAGFERYIAKPRQTIIWGGIGFSI